MCSWICKNCGKKLTPRNAYSKSKCLECHRIYHKEYRDKKKTIAEYTNQEIIRMNNIFKKHLTSK